VLERFGKEKGTVPRRSRKRTVRRILSARMKVN